MKKKPSQALLSVLKPSSANPVTTIRFTPEDHKLIEDLAKKLGGSLPSVLRQGLRVLAAKEGISA